jgi:hypothetical protein
VSSRPVPHGSSPAWRGVAWRGVASVSCGDEQVSTQLVSVREYGGLRLCDAAYVSWDAMQAAVRQRGAQYSMKHDSCQWSLP